MFYHTRYARVCGIIHIASIEFAPRERRPGPHSRVTGRVSGQGNFLNDSKLICPVQSCAKKHSASVVGQITGLTTPISPDEGRLAIVTKRAVRCGGREGCD